MTLDLSLNIIPFSELFFSDFLKYLHLTQDFHTFVSPPVPSLQYKKKNTHIEHLSRSSLNMQI